MVYLWNKDKPTFIRIKSWKIGKKCAVLWWTKSIIPQRIETT